MSNIENEQITDLKNVLTDFILEQRQFNAEQRQFNILIDKKIDKVQYFLEETIADNTKILFEEQVNMRG